MHLPGAGMVTGAILSVGIGAIGGYRAGTHHARSGHRVGAGLAPRDLSGLAYAGALGGATFVGAGLVNHAPGRVSTLASAAAGAMIIGAAGGYVLGALMARDEPVNWRPSRRGART